MRISIKMKKLQGVSLAVVKLKNMAFALRVVKNWVNCCGSNGFMPVWCLRLCMESSTEQMECWNVSLYGCEKRKSERKDLLKPIDALDGFDKTFFKYLSTVSLIVLQF